jgi:hypothetical protein
VNNLAVASVDSRIITASSQPGRIIPLRQGEVIRGIVVDSDLTGGVVLAVRGVMLEGRSELPLRREQEVLLRVAAELASGEIKLQFMGYAEDEEPPLYRALKGDREGDVALEVRRLARQLSRGPLDRQEVADLLQRLPSERNLPRHERLELKELLRQAVAQNEVGIMARYATLARQLATPGFLPPLPLQFTIPLGDPKALQRGIVDSGVGLEQKLAHLVAEREGLAKDLSGKPLPLGRGQLLHEKEFLDSDLKGELLKLRQSFLSATEPSVQRMSGDHRRELLKETERLLADIENFQLLSHVSGGIATFLPMNWPEMNRGDIAIRRGKSGNGEGVSCRIDLELTHHGRLIVSLLATGGAIFASFRVEQDQFAEQLRHGMEELLALCQRQGIPLANAHVLPLTESALGRIEELEDFDTLVSVSV